MPCRAYAGRRPRPDELREVHGLWARRRTLPRPRAREPPARRGGADGAHSGLPPGRRYRVRFDRDAAGGELLPGFRRRHRGARLRMAAGAGARRRRPPARERHPALRRPHARRAAFARASPEPHRYGRLAGIVPLLSRAASESRPRPRARAARVLRGRARLRAGAGERNPDRLRGGRRLRPHRRAEYRARVRAGRALEAGHGAERRHSRRAEARGGRAATALRSRQPAPALMNVTTDPYAPVHWELVPGRTVLAVIDAQRDFLHPDGWYARSGVDISHMRRVIEPTKRLLAAARRAAVPVVWTRHGYKDGSDG